ERDMRRLWVRVEYADALAQAVGEEACAPDRERLRGVAGRADRRALGVHQLERRDVVLLRVRGEEERLGAVDAHLVAGEELRVVVVEPERARCAQRETAVVFRDEDELIFL